MNFSSSKNATKNIYMNGILYGVGVGPGSEDLLTLKAVKVLKECDVVIAPKALKDGESIALNTAKNFIGENTEIYKTHFPMGKKDREEKIYDIYKLIEKLTGEGKKVAFLTIGDPFLYSTYIYILDYIKKTDIKFETVPGINSFSAAASVAGETLVIGNEPLLILPASKINNIKDEKFIVLMKFYKKEEEVLEILEEKGFKYVCIRRACREGESILYTREEILNSRDYMSLIIAHRD